MEVRKIESRNFCSDNILIIKKAIAAEGPQDKNSLIKYLQNNWGKNIDYNEASRLVNLPLHARQSAFFLNEANLWDFDRTDNKINNLAFQLFSQGKRPLTEIKVTEKIQLAYKIPPEDISAHLNFTADPRFRVFEIFNCTYWGLSEWQIVNNLAFIILFHQENNNMEIRALEKELKKEFPLKKNSLFVPEIDPRFGINRNNIKLTSAAVNLLPAEQYPIAITKKDIEKVNNDKKSRLLLNLVPLHFEHPHFIACYLYLENMIYSNSLQTPQDAAMLARSKLIKYQNIKKSNSFWNKIQSIIKPNLNFYSRQEDRPFNNPNQKPFFHS